MAPYFMKTINFYNPRFDEEDDKAFRLITEVSTCGLGYKILDEELRKLGYYLPEDQYDAFDKVLSIQLCLDIGSRKYEWEPDGGEQHRKEDEEAIREFEEGMLF